MTHPAQTADLHVAPTAPRYGLWARARNHLSQVNAAHARQSRIQHLTGEEARDTGLPVEVFMDENSYDAALPFFFQSGFGRR